MSMKKVLSVLLVLVLLLSVLPIGAMAQLSAVPIESPRLEKILIRGAVAAPTLSAGHHQHYLDRVSTLPGYAWEYYRWLEANAGANGVLADPTKATESNGEYYHAVTHVNGSKQFTFTSKEEMLALAEQIAYTELDKELASFGIYAGVVRDAFDREHPEVFWLNGKSSYSYIGNWSYDTQGKVCTVTYQADMVIWLQYPGFDIRDSKYLDPKAVASAIKTRDDAIREILSACPKGSVYDRVVYLNDALTARNAYNRAVEMGNDSKADSDAWKSISALVGRSGNSGPVCEGYARAFQVLCNELKIPCVLVNGEAKSKKDEQPDGHMWNYVQVNGSWYAVDVTWNDPYVASKPEQKKSGNECRDWLLLGSDTQVAIGLNFLQSHIVTNRVRPDGLSYTNGPVLERAAYDPNALSVGSISGTVKSTGNGPVTVELWQGNALKETQSLSGSTVSFTFADVAAGGYQLKISKDGHVTRSEELTVANRTVILDLKLCKLGDVTGDGKINVGDIGRIYAYIKKTSKITDPYVLLCADATGDGRINVGDTARLYASIRK